LARPNIVLIHSHDTGRYIGAYGYAVETPNLDRLAHEGTLFRQAFSAAPTCSPSRAALLTGRYPHEVGMFGSAKRGFTMARTDMHLVRTLKEAGYITALAGVEGTAPDGESGEYDEVLGPAENAHETAGAFVRGASQPFFVSVGFQEAHRPYPQMDDEGPVRLHPPPHLPLTSETVVDMLGFAASLAEMDRKVGEVLRAVDESGRRGDTLVIYTTDHGPAFPGMKATLRDLGLGVALILHGPGGFACGRGIDDMASHLDIFPTLCEAAGVPAPPGLRGTSLVPLAEGRGAGRTELAAEQTYHAAYEPQRCIRTVRYKYIRRFEPYTHPVVCNIDDGPSKDVWLRAGWLDHRGEEEEELYDLIFDAGEMRNLIHSPDHPAVLAEMRRRLGRWMHDTGDPLRLGPIPAPPGADILRPDAASPDETADVGA
jgi:N-sulfoglucosamine sulfohydrolase